MNKLKKYRSVFWGGIITILSCVAYVSMSSSNDNLNDEQIKADVANIPVRKITPSIQNINIPILGRVQAQRKFDLYSEVNGIITKGNQEILSGTFFKKGEVIGHINADQFTAELLAQKSAFKASIVSVMAIVKLDFKDSFNAWNEYLVQLDPEKPLQNLPEYASQKESLYFISNGIEELYYKIKSQEELLKKYTLLAPFDGFLSEVDIKEGALLNAGQRVATFIGSKQFDIVADIKKDHLKWIRINDILVLENGKKARITRLSNLVDQNTQTVRLYASITDNDLFHGEYISGEINCSQTVIACKINRKLIIDDDKIMISENNVVKKVKVEKVISTNDYSLIQGFKNSFNILNKISGVKVGQRIKPVYVK